jgi:type IV pilus assembly protein PilN
MRFNINLASQPYEVAQTYKRQMTLAIVGLSVAAVLLLSYILYQHVHSRGINRQLAQVQSQILSLQNEEAQARAILNRPANKVVADQSDFLNQLFARKALSWTHVFTEMEKIVPPDLHVVSMKPEYTKTNDLVLHVIVATDSRERAVEMVSNMEKSSHLRGAQIVAETVTTNSGEQAAGGGNIQFDIGAIYVPGAADMEDVSTDTTAKPGQTGAPANKAANPPKMILKAGTAQAGSPGNVNAAQNRPIAPGARGH